MANINRAPRARTVRKRVTVGIAAVALGLTTQVTGISSVNAASQDTSKTLAIDAGTLTTFNPFTAYFDSELDIFGSIYPSLTQLNISGNPGPSLADSWQTSADKLTWTFKIHPGLKWSDGQPLTAKDAAYTFNLIMSNPNAAKANGSLVSNFAKVTAADDTTLAITTKSPQANVLFVSIPVSGVPIVPEHIWKSHEKGIADYKNMDFPVVGYGPWVLSGFVTDQYATLMANKSYFLGAPKYDKLILQYFKNTDAAVAALKSGQLQKISALTATQYDALKSDPTIKTYQTVAQRWLAIEVNSGAKTQAGKPMGTGNPALANQNVRIAIARAIDRQTLVDKVLNGKGVAGGGYLPPGWASLWWPVPADQKLGFDLAQANTLLDQAGYPKGSDGTRRGKDGKLLSIRLGIHSDSANDASVAAYVAGWFKQIGIKLVIEPMTPAKLNANLAIGDWDMLMDGWGTGPDPSYLLGIQTCASLPTDTKGTAGYTDAFYCNPNFDTLFNKQVTEFDPVARKATIDQMQAILYKANVDIILYYANGLSAVRQDKVSNFLYGQPDGQGFYPGQLSYLSWAGAKPVAAAASTSSSSSTTWRNIAIIAAVLLLLLLIVLIARRRSGSTSDKE